MLAETNGAVLSQLQRLFHEGTVAGLGEGQLLDRFVAQRDEIAFHALVCRHGPMVLGVCRRVLRDPRDVEDAFQATFLILVRKAAVIRDRELLAHWLYGVAYRVAVRSKAQSARIRAHESIGIALETVGGTEISEWDDVVPVLDEELSRLPEKFRLPIVLCHLEGRTHDEAAEKLRCPVGTVRSRLARGRERLRVRLIRRGLGPTSLLGAGTTVLGAELVVPAALVESTVSAALRFAAVKTISAGIVSTSAILLTEGVLRTMFLSKLRLVAAGAVTLGLVAVASAVPPSEKSQAQPAGPAQGVVPATATAPTSQKTRQAGPTASATKAFVDQLEGYWNVVTVEPLRQEAVPLSWSFHGPRLIQTVLTPVGKRQLLQAYTVTASEGVMAIHIDLIEARGGSKRLRRTGPCSIDGDQLSVLLNPMDEDSISKITFRRDHAVNRAHLDGGLYPRTAARPSTANTKSVDLSTYAAKQHARKLLTIARQLLPTGQFDDAEAVAEVVRGMNLAWDSVEDAPENVISAIEMERSRSRQAAHEAKATPVEAPIEKPAVPVTSRDPVPATHADSQADPLVHIISPPMLGPGVRRLEHRLAMSRETVRYREPLFQRGAVSREQFERARAEVESVLEEIETLAEQSADQVELLRIEVEQKTAELREAEARIDQTKGLIASFSMRLAKGVGDDPDPRHEFIKAKGEQRILEAQRDAKQAALRDSEFRLAKAIQRHKEADRLKGLTADTPPTRAEERGGRDSAPANRK